MLHSIFLNEGGPPTTHTQQSLAAISITLHALAPPATTLEEWGLCEGTQRRENGDLKKKGHREGACW